MSKEIVQKDNTVLREIAKEVSIDEITHPEMQSILSDMREALDKEHDGVAIAAPQINISKRIFIVSPKAYHADESDEEKHLVFINPEIIKRSKDRKVMEEGCLSVRWWYGKVRRSSRATVRAYDEYGNVFTQEGRGLIAQIFQHEIDHLNGILFIDKAHSLEELPPAVG